MVNKTIITAELILKVQNLKEVDQLPITHIAKITKVSRSTIYKILKKELGYRFQPAKLIKKSAQHPHDIDEDRKN